MSTEFAPEPQVSGLRFSLNRVATAAALAVFSLISADAWALGLGRLNVQSALGEPLRAEIDVTSLSPQEAASLKVRIASPQTYSTAGVEFNPVLAVAKLSLERRANGSPFLRLTSERAVTEPFVDTILELQWASGRLVREYTLLLDPPSLARTESTTVAVTSPPPMTPVVMDSPEPILPPVEQPTTVSAVPGTPLSPSSPAKAGVAKDDLLVDKPVGKELPTKLAAPTSAKPVATAASSPVVVVKPIEPKNEPKSEVTDKTTELAQALRVKAGDSISRLAEKNLLPGVSLDQMMVGLYRGNPQAFLGDNMNRLKAGVVLKVPSVDASKAIAPQEARQLIVAQSADFEAFRQRLASGATTSVAPAQQRQAAGKVEAEVADRQQLASPTPDKLTLSKGGMAAGKPAGAEDYIAQNRAKEDSTARVTELSRNLDDLRKMKEQVVKPAPMVDNKAAEVVAKAASKAAAQAASEAAALSAIQAAQKASQEAATTLAVQMAAKVASQAAVNTPAITAAAQVPSVPTPWPTPASEPVAAEVPPSSLLERINPAVLAGVGGLVVLLAGGGVYWRSRRRKEDGEVAFIESRLQPDSFFGASGGQRVDTHDAASPSSMSYSLSQIDAIGDVDPVAEADVYLAYGRDLQAEEILNEALRNNPQATAVRAKLVEVYVKRNDTKGAEHVTKELFNMTNGEGPDWQRAQELGMSIDPDNPLYQSGKTAVASLPEPTGESDHTMPMSAMIKAAAVSAAPVVVAEDASNLADLDLDISLPPTPAMLDLPKAEPQPLVKPTEHLSSDVVDADLSIEFDQPMAEQEASSPQAALPPSAPVPFDLSAISLDLDDGDVTLVTPVKPMSMESSEPVSSKPVPLDVPNDPMMHKVELANEFIQIGDIDGAKDLLKEVLTQGQEATQAKARELLDRLT